MWITRFMVLSLLSVGLFLMTGCGSSSGSFNPVPSVKTGGSTQTTTPFQNISTTSGRLGISLATDRPSIDANAGQVVVTASITDSTGAGVAGKTVTFSIMAGPATIDPSLGTVATDSNGKAISFLLPGDTPTTTNVILKATTTVGLQTANAYATVQIVRGSEVITFITEKKPTDPDGTLFTLDQTFEPELASLRFEMMQQMPFKVTDPQGNPRVGVPVTLSIDNQLTGRATIRIERATVVTDSHGQGIFNVGVTMTTPEPGGFFADSIIYKAVTTETAPKPPLLTYGGFIISYATKKPQPLAATPEAVAFSENDTVGATKKISLTGGDPFYDYTVSSSNPALVSAVQSGRTVTVTLADASLWTGSVTITVTNQAGEQILVPVTRK